MIRGKYKAAVLRVGLRVGAACGPGEFPEDRPGTITEKEVTRWGTTWKVQLDDGSQEWISGVQTTAMGIGWYAIEEAA